MRKLATLILLILMVVPFTLYAQDESELVFSDLDAEFTVTDLQLTFAYPSDWLWDGSDGIVLAETEADIAAYTDDDDTTQPTGMLMTLNAFPADTFGIEDPTLDSIVDFIVEATELEVIEVVEVPVMARRSVSVIGVNPAGRAGIGTVWIQDDFAVLFSLGTPESEMTLDIVYSWGFVLGTITPITTFELTETLGLPDYGITLNYPEGWTPVVDEASVAIYELESDATRPDTSEGLAFIILVADATPEDYQLPAEPELTDLETLLSSFIVVEEPAIATEEYLVLDFEGAGLFGLDGEQNVLASFLFDVEGGQVMITGLGSEDAEYLLANETTFMAILQSISALE